MTGIRVYPGSVRGRVRAPPSKSYTHRALVVGYLSGHPFRVERPLDADDTRRTAEAIRRLGASVTRRDARWTVKPGRPPRTRRVSVDCGESGTTLRFAVALAARQGTRVRFTGRERLGQRPMRALLRGLRSLGASIRVSKHGLPLEVSGPIHGGPITLDASVSSQFLSSLLLALPTLEGDSRIVLTGPVVSSPYIDATLAVLNHQGVRVARRGRSFQIPGGQRFRGRSFRVPGDASSAAYLWAAGAVAGGPVRVDGVPPAWPQADRAATELLAHAGAAVREIGSSVAVGAGRPRPFTVDLTDSPDLYPLAGVLAALTPGTSRLRGAAHVVHKESDRRAGTARLARAFGARVRTNAGGLTIEGTDSPRRVSLTDLTDHRLLMSAAVGALSADGPSRLGPAEAVEKSFPGFWDSMRALGAEVEGP
ncbi:MAG TPA: 3-phosphoshikimate 1-carboxyvinyltransferase [Thermoplasmata archaeon]|nr:3-phosphoshikimate 1-carboxyvinyltransferase [Thermoplasmata archaeon]